MNAHVYCNCSYHIGGLNGISLRSGMQRVLSRDAVIAVTERRARLKVPSTAKL